MSEQSTAAARQWLVKNHAQEAPILLQLANTPTQTCVAEEKVYLLTAKDLAAYAASRQSGAAPSTAPTGEHADKIADFVLNNWHKQGARQGLIELLRATPAPPVAATEEEAREWREANAKGGMLRLDGQFYYNETLVDEMLTAFANRPLAPAKEGE